MWRMRIGKKWLNKENFSNKPEKEWDDVLQFKLISQNDVSLTFLYATWITHMITYFALICTVPFSLKNEMLAKGLRFFDNLAESNCTCGSFISYISTLMKLLSYFFHPCEKYFSLKTHQKEGIETFIALVPLDCYF